MAHLSPFDLATKNRLPLITGDIEEKLHGYIVGKADFLNCIVHAIGGIEDHVHLAVSIPPKLSVSDFLGQIKGSSSHHVSHGLGNCQKEFSWQRGYGVFTLGETQLGRATEYVLNQKQRHLEGNLIRLLERVEEEDDGPSKKSERSEIAEELIPWPTEELPF